MASIEEAKELIQQIRRELTVDGPAEEPRPILAILERALAPYSDQLYEKSTHFLLELIQNADDNSYTSKNPTLNFTYRKGRLRVDCNEVGFSSGNVRAICDVGNSTKSGIGHSTRYIGEKGIGFKSVFRVANVVFISSRYFSFKFDRMKTIGMIAPIWEEFPEKKKSPDHTSFYLQLLGEPTESEVVTEIQTLDARMLIFLRQLREINLSITCADGKTKTQNLRRIDKKVNGVQITTLHYDSMSWDFIVSRHLVSDMPDEPKRPGCSVSEILIAFPISNYKSGPQKDSQCVYAFLPIRDYGFYFLLQGDFLLTANREGIDNSLRWNCAIRNAAEDAFVTALDPLISGDLKYHWPRYLPIGKVDPFFMVLKDGILRSLKEKSIIESCASSMAKPSDLFYPPPGSFRDDTGVPFTMTASTKSKFLSGKYPDWAIDPLLALGVKKMTERDFLNELKQMILNETKIFQEKPKSWHSQLAKALLPLATVKEHRDVLVDMKLIPLRSVQMQTGEWVAAQNRQVFFSSKTSNNRIPATIPVDIVSPDADDDVDRRSLFTQLGVKPCEDAAICQTIVRMHAEWKFDAQTFTAEELLSHAVFLYKASWQPPDNTELWFATSTQKRCKGSELYIRSMFKSKSAAQRVNEQLQAKFPFMHDMYLTALPKDHRWLTWLCRSFNVSTIPRISTKPLASSPDSFQLSPEFKYIFDRCESIDVIEVIRENWDYYSSWIEESSSGKDSAACIASKEQLKAAIGSIPVSWRRGTAALRDTVLPALDPIVDESPCVRSLTIRDPLLHQWQVLRRFGVKVKKDIGYYMRCLEAIQGSNAPKQTIAHIYGKIQNEYSNNEQVIWERFREFKIIYSCAGSKDPKAKMQWFSTKECIQRSFDLEFEYPQATNLFQFLLSTGKGEIGKLIAGAMMITSASKLGQIAEHFARISRALKGMNLKKAAQAIKPLAQRPLFPIIQKEGEAEFDVLAPLGTNKDWLVADSPPMRDSFRGKVSLLAFEVSDLEMMEDLLTALHLDARKLTMLVKMETKPKGTTSLNAEYTRLLQAKSPFIIALIPKLHAERNAIAARMKRVRVSVAARIEQNFVLQLGSTTHVGRNGNGEVASQLTSDRLQIFMTEDAVEDPCPSDELVDLIAEHCKIEEKYQPVLHTALTQRSKKKLLAFFKKRGIHVDSTSVEEDLDSDKHEKRYVALSGDIETDASPFLPRDPDDDPSIDGLKAGAKRALSTAASTLRSGGWCVDKTRSSKVVTRVDPVQKESGKINESSGLSPPQESYVVVKRTTPQDILYLGELLTSMLFHHYFGAAYRPELHWTSPLRYRTGHYDADKISAAKFSTEESSFTISDKIAVPKVTEFLIHHNFHPATSWKGKSHIYHFEVAATPGENTEPFSWSTSRLERMRKYRINEQLKDDPKHVLILVRICKIYSDPGFDLFIDPWQLYSSDRFNISPAWSIVATISNLKPPKAPEKEPAKPFGGYGSSASQPASSQPSMPYIPSPYGLHGSYGQNQNPYYRYQRGVAMQYPEMPSRPMNLFQGATDTANQYGWHPPYANGFNNGGWPPTMYASYQAPSYYTSMPLDPLSARPNPPVWNQSNPHPPPAWNSSNSSGWGGMNPQAQRFGMPTCPSPMPFSSPIPGPVRLPPSPPYQSENSKQNRDPASSDDSFLKPLRVTGLKAESGVSPAMYTYKNLAEGHIRLLSLLPGEDDGELRGMVSHVPVRGAGRYRAVSYVWGEVEWTHSMWTPEGTIPMTESLHSALKWLRNNKEPMVLWVDAVCINQSDGADKARQIRLLPLIFELATCVLAYLGDSTHSDTALETLMQIQAKDALRGRRGPWPKELPEVPLSWNGEAIPLASDPIWNDILALFERSWFRRAWILQEVVTATSVRIICGRWVVDWNDLFHAMEVVSREASTSDSFSSMLSTWAPFMTLARHRELQAIGQRMPLIELLESFRYAESTLQRDRFFSLLGFAEDGELSGFEVDYQGRLEDIVRKYAAAFVEQGMGMQLLHRAGLGSSDNNNGRFPSWIPDWTVPKQRSLCSLSERGPPLAAAGGTRSDVRCDPSSTDELLVGGMVVDEIRSVSKTSNMPDQLRAYLKEIDAAVEALPSYPVHERDRESRFDVKWKVAIASAWHPRKVASGDIDMRSSYIALKEYYSEVLKAKNQQQKQASQFNTNKSNLGGRPRGKANGSAAPGGMMGKIVLDELWARAQNYVLAMQDDLSGWKFVVTRRGFVGVAPPAVQEGDAVAIFDGGAVPFLIRPGKKKPESFRLVGECYVHGIMNGESKTLCHDAKHTTLRLH